MIIIKGVRKSHSNVSLHELEVVMNDSNSDRVDTNLDTFFDHVKTGSTPHTIIIDASTSFDVAATHSTWLLKGVIIKT